ncbi:hypothetical protein BN1723_011049, partial [Verticillium longisporum]
MKFSLALQVAALAAFQGAAAAPAANSCYCLPGDACWPKESAWSRFNSTVGGRLVATVPIGSPCHDPTYDAAACAQLQSQWTNPLTHIPSSSSVMQTYFANQSCDPFTDRAKPCTLGNYVSYAVDVECSSDVARALKFAKANNLRVVVRNTGHDFLGRSTGAGALAIWTNHLKSIDFVDWDDEYYTGPAVSVGAGVQGYEILEAANAKGLSVVTGECATVGLAGGFTQGGGHSALSTHTLSYRDHYDRYMGPLPKGSLEVARYQFGGRLIPRSAFSDANRPALKAVIGNLTANGVLAVGSAGTYKKPAGAANNSVFPAWRDTLVQMQLITDW